MRNVRDVFRDIPEIVLVRHPSLGIETPEMNGPRKTSHGFSAVAIRIFMKMGHHELADGGIHRIAIAEREVIRFMNGAPAAVLSEYGHHMRVIAWHRFNINQQGRMAVDAESERREHGALNAVRRFFSHDPPRGHAGFTAPFKIDRQAVQILLDFPWAIQPSQKAELSRR